MWHTAEGKQIKRQEVREGCCLLGEASKTGYSVLEIHFPVRSAMPNHPPRCDRNSLPYAGNIVKLRHIHNQWLPPCWCRPPLYDYDFSRTLLFEQIRGWGRGKANGGHKYKLRRVTEVDDTSARLELLHCRCNTGPITLIKKQCWQNDLPYYIIIIRQLCDCNCIIPEKINRPEYFAPWTQTQSHSFGWRALMISASFYF